MSAFGFVFLVITPGAGYIMILLALISYILVFKLIYDSKTMRVILQGFQDVRFRVLDGTVSAIQLNPTTPGAWNVRFTSLYGQTCDRWFLAREEGLEMGSPLLLVTVDWDAVKKDITRVFTPFMMTEEGSRKHW